MIFDQLKLMTDGKYVDYYEYDRVKVETLLSSNKAEDNLNGLLYTVLGSNDFEKSDKLIFHFCASEISMLKQNAILCIGHLVRIYKQIDLEKYIPILDHVLVTQQELFLSEVENALSDIWIFYLRGKIRAIQEGTCVSRYFNTFQISYEAEINADYDKGIGELEELKKNELNPSVQYLQGTCITYLNNLKQASTET